MSFHLSVFFDFGAPVLSFGSSTFPFIPVLDIPLSRFPRILSRLSARIAESSSVQCWELPSFGDRGGWLEEFARKTTLCQLSEVLVVHFTGVAFLMGVVRIRRARCSPACAYSLIIAVISNVNEKLDILDMFLQMNAACQALMFSTQNHLISRQQPCNMTSLE